MDYEFRYEDLDREDKGPDIAGTHYWIAKEKLTTIDTFELCNRFGILPDILGFCEYKLTTNLAKTDIFGERLRGNIQNIKQNHMPRLELKGVCRIDEIRPYCLSEDDYKYIMQEAIKSLMRSEEFVHNEQCNKFARTEVSPEFDSYIHTDNVMSVITPDNKVVILSEESYSRLKITNKDSGMTSTNYLAKYMIDRFKVDVTIHLDNTLREIDYVSKFLDSINSVMKADRVVISRPTELNYVLVYTEKSLDNYQTTAEATKDYRKQHWSNN